MENKDRDGKKKQRKQRKVRCDVTERDAKIFRFLWKWKLISTVALAIKFFPVSDTRTAYRRLLALEKDGYIKSVRLEKRFHEAWCLSKKGFQFIQESLGDLQSLGYKSEYPIHDHVASAFHLGEWLVSQPEYTQNYSEQQLRRYPKDLWPNWVPQSTIHRPDGYSLYFKGELPVVVAFEAELNVKAKERYQSAVAFYDSQTSVQFVFWLVDSKGTMNALLRIFEKFQMRERDKHHFLLLSEFQKHGWMTPFENGKFKSRCPFDFLMHLAPPRPTLAPARSSTLALLDTLKKPMVSAGSKSAACAEKPD